MLEVTIVFGVLLAMQYTRFPLSSFTTLLCNNDIVLVSPPSSLDIKVASFVISMDDLYHVMLACGLLADVVHVRFISCPAVNVISVGVKVTNVTGTALSNETLKQI